MAVGALLSLIPSIISLFSSNKSSNEYQDRLAKMREQQRLSNSALQAKQLFAENAGRGLPGFETMREDINNQLPTTLNEAKDWLTGGGVVDYLTRAKTSTDRQLRDLNAANEEARQKNYMMYANYLGGAMANREDALQAARNEIDSAAAFGKVYADASKSNTLSGMAGNVSGITTEDLSKLIALFGGKSGGGKLGAMNLPITDYTSDQIG